VPRRAGIPLATAYDAAMAQEEHPLQIQLPPGTEQVLGVYAGGVELREGEDFEVLRDRITFRTGMRSQAKVGAFGKVLLSIGIGVYPKGDVIDLQIRRRGRTEVVRGRPLRP
jgi:hypothetical protein